MKKVGCIISFCLLVLASCNQNQEQKEDTKVLEQPQAEINASKKPLQIEIIRLEQEIFKKKSRRDIKLLFDQNTYFAEKFLKKDQYPHDSVLVNAFYNLSVNKSLDTLFQTTENVFGDFYEIGLELENALLNIQKFDPKFKIPKIYTIITGMGNDLYVDDSIIVIGLDFFLAEKSQYKPQLPLYMLKRYRKEYIVPMIVTLISSKYNESDYLDNSMIAEMVYFGKSYYFLNQIMPDVNDTIIAGYENKVLKDVVKNQDLIWAHFIEKNLLFETKNEVVTRYTGERPITYEIGNNCPGRIGRWLGWEIVKAYVDRNDVDLKKLMKQKDAKALFYKSKYKPKK